MFENHQVWSAYNYTGYSLCQTTLAIVASFFREEIEATCNFVALSLGHSSLQEQQNDVITKFVAGSDVFAILPRSLHVMSVYLAYFISF